MSRRARRRLRRALLLAVLAVILALLAAVGSGPYRAALIPAGLLVAHPLTALVVGEGRRRS